MTQRPRLIVLRGPSGAGKSTVASQVREALGPGTALISQDVLRREIVAEHDRPEGVTPAVLFELAARLLHADFDVIVEGMMRLPVYGDVLRDLASLDGVEFYAFRLRVELELALSRHRTRAWSARVSDEVFTEWFDDFEQATLPCEMVIDASAPASSVTGSIMGIVGGRMRDRPPASRARLAGEREATA